MNSFSLKGAVLALTLIISTSVAQAKLFDRNQYLDFGSAEVEEVAPTALHQNSAEMFILANPQVTASGPQTQSVAAGLGDIVNLGKFAWAIIEGNRPVGNVTSDIANALPRGTESWHELAGWSAPEAKAYHVAYKNKFGKTVVDFTYQVLFTHSGNVRGTGLYLTNVTVIPTHLSVAWGYKMTASATVPVVMNAGTLEAPIAAAQVVMKWKLETLVKSEQNAKAYMIMGDGRFEETSQIHQ